ncbi:Wzz/FepE/Etk N-terminal domain-containing protein [Nocardioides sp. C4-1]|uniref:Wzz/FepE/Etk N-terminal domain-containing protein n=1 Tax=Nocardioides sp. C4-1 TaxID=3151851 RepID=UPI003267B304
MDLLEQAAGVWARRWIVLAVAVVAAVGVFAWRSTAPEHYTASATVQVRVPVTDDSDPTPQVSYYATQVSGRAATPGVVEAALGLLGRDDDSDAVRDAAEEITTDAGDEPGFVVISASGESGEEAAVLADAVAQVLGDQVRTDQADDVAEKRSAITDSIAAVAEERRRTAATNDIFAVGALDREREALLGALRTLADTNPWRLALVEPADVPESPDAPRPLRDALLAFLVFLVLTAEGVVLVRAFRGSLSARDAAADVTRATGLAATVVPASAGATAVAPLLPAIGEARDVVVVGVGAGAEGRSAGLLADLLAARGDLVVLHDVSDGSSATAGDDERVVLAAEVATVDDLLPLASALSGPVVLEVDQRTSRRAIQSEVTTMRALDLDVVAVALRESVRSPGRESRGSDDAAGVDERREATAGATA